MIPGRELTVPEANRFADGWIDAWNTRDLEAILAHYRDDVIFTSPLVEGPAAAPGGTLRGKQELREHFRRLLEETPGLRLFLYHVAVGVDSVTLVYRGGRDRLAVEMAVLDADQRIVQVRAHYAAA